MEEGKGKERKGKERKRAGSLALALRYLLDERKQGVRWRRRREKKKASSPRSLTTGRGGSASRAEGKEKCTSVVNATLASPALHRHRTMGFVNRGWRSCRQMGHIFKNGSWR